MQQLVTRRMSQRVIDVLEVVNVQQQQGQRRCGVALDAAERHVGPVGQQGPVGQSGEGVEVRQILDAPLGSLPVAQVAEHADVVGGHTQPHGPQRHPGQKELAVALAQQQLSGPATLLVKMAAQLDKPRRADLRLRKHPFRRGTDHFALGIAGQLAAPAVQHHDAVPCIGNQDAFTALFINLGGNAQLVLAGLLLGNVENQRRHPERLAVAVHQRGVEPFTLDKGTIPGLVHVDGVPAPFLPHQALQHFAIQRGAHLGRQDEKRMLADGLFAREAEHALGRPVPLLDAETVIPFDGCQHRLVQKQLPAAAAGQQFVLPARIVQRILKDRHTARHLARRGTQRSEHGPHPQLPRPARNRNLAEKMAYIARQRLAHGPGKPRDRHGSQVQAMNGLFGQAHHGVEMTVADHDPPGLVKHQKTERQVLEAVTEPVFVDAIDRVQGCGSQLVHHEAAVRQPVNLHPYGLLPAPGLRQHPGQPLATA